jgi:predicted dehydrogenase
VLADPDIELIINLTIPAAHAEIGLVALQAGKSVYNEKPLAISRGDGQLLLQEAQARGLRVGNAPDTFLGGGLQTCRHLLDAGEIGTPIAATGFMFIRGPEVWHPDPGFLYQVGAGPLFDIGPYYLTALISMLGAIRRVTGSGRITYPERTIGSGPKQGQKIPVETPTHIAGVLDFASGPVATLITSFDVSVSAGAALDLYGVGGALLEIQGTEGTLSLPDPNIFAGPVRVRRLDETEWREVPLTHAHTTNSRCLGVADMAYALRTGRPHRANGEMAFHVLDVMHAILEASETGRHIELASTCERPAPLPTGLPEGQLDA